MKKLLLALTLLSVATISAQVQTPMSLPGQTGTLSGSVRGYYFTAPTCFTITGLQVPTDASSGTQSIAVVRFWSNATPPLYSNSTNAFTLLYLTQNDPTTGIIPVNIQVEQGDVIGILGYRGGNNSYGVAGYTSTINGYPVTLNRLGMQYPLTSTPPQELWTENGGSISRVIMYYDPAVTYTSSHSVLNAADVQFATGSDTSFTSVWDFGDSSPQVTADNPIHTYAVGGTYTACNYITNSCGTQSVCMTVTVCGNAVVTANYSAAVTANTVAFNNSSTNGTEWHWDFGDATTSTAQNPTHVYTASGTYNVCMIASDGGCYSDTICSTVTVCVPTQAGFSGSLDTSGAWEFLNNSVNATSYHWDFGDMTTSTAANPTHTYTMDGTYNVCLIASDCVSDTFCTTITTCPEMLSAAFTSADTLTDATFTSMSASAVSYLWDFGDMNTSTAANPTHTYASTGLYTVCLTVWNLCGDSATACDTVLLIITGNTPAGHAQVGIYPNPAQDAAVIDVVSMEYSGVFVFEMYDAAGKLVRAQNGVFGQRMTVERNELSGGIYLYKIRTGDAVISNGKIMFTE